MKKMLLNFWPQILIVFITLFFFRNFLFSEKMIFGQDVIGLNYPVEQFATDAFKSGQLPAWNPYAASGYPFLAFSSVFYPLNVIFRILPTYLAFNWTYFLHFLIAGLGMFYLLRHFKLSKLASFFGAIVFEFGGFFSTRMYAGHYMFVQSVSWFPLALIFADFLTQLQNKRFLLIARYVIGLAVSLSMIILAGHPQPSFYFGYGLIIYVLTKLVIKIFLEKQPWKLSAINLFPSLIITLLLTALLTSPFLIPSFQALKTSLRQGQIDYGSATSYSLSPKKLLLFLAPFYFGSYVTNDYHGGSIFHEMNYYLGVIPFILVVFVGFRLLGAIGRIGRIGPIQWREGLRPEQRQFLANMAPFLALSLYAFFIAFGAINPFYKLIYHYVPGFGSLRAPARALMIFSFSGAVLAAFGLMKIFKIFKIFKDGPYKTRPIIKILPVILVTITIFDLFSFSSKLFVSSEPDIYFSRDELVQFLQENTKDDLGRVWLLPNTLLSNRGSIFKFFDVQSDVPMTIGWYSNLIDAFKARDENLNKAGERAVIHVNNGKLLSLLGTKYLVSKDGIGDSEELHLVAEPKIRIFSDFDKRLPSVLEKDVCVYERHHYLPRVKLYSDVKKVKNEDEAIKELTKDDFDEFKTVIVEVSTKFKSLFDQISGCEECGTKATIKSYDLNEVTIETYSKNPKFLLFNDVYYPGWKAYIDDKETKIYKSNLAFRGIIVPSGKHQVRFIYKPYKIF